MRHPLSWRCRMGGGGSAEEARWVAAALERAVEVPPRQLGLLFDAWTSDRLSAYLAETTGVRIAPGWVRALLARRRYRTGRPKHTLGHLQDVTAKTACEQELQAVGEKGWGGRGRVRISLPGRDPPGDQPA